MFFDCPSGTGKTQAGIALMLIAQAGSKVGGRDLIVAHIVWPNAVRSQRIYREIQSDQAVRGIVVDNFSSEQASG